MSSIGLKNKLVRFEKFISGQATDVSRTQHYAVGGNMKKNVANISC